MILQNIPDDFSPLYEVVGVFVECNGEILMMRRHPKKPEGNTWCGPGGKLDLGETESEAVVREVYEETGIFAKLAEFTRFHRVPVRYADYDFWYTIYRLRLLNRPVVELTLAEHTEFRWVTPADALKLDLIEDEDACIRMVYNI